MRYQHLIESRFLRTHNKRFQIQITSIRNHFLIHDVYLRRLRLLKHDMKKLRYLDKSKDISFKKVVTIIWPNDPTRQQWKKIIAYDPIRFVPYR